MHVLLQAAEQLVVGSRCDPCCLYPYQCTSQQTVMHGGTWMMMMSKINSKELHA